MTSTKQIDCPECRGSGVDRDSDRIAALNGSREPQPCCACGGDGEARCLFHPTIMAAVVDGEPVCAACCPSLGMVA